MPESWIKEKERLKRAGVPPERFIFKKKWELASGLLTKISKQHLPYEAVVFDAGYGEIKEFLRWLDAQGEVFLAQIPESHTFWPVDVPLTSQSFKRGRPRLYPAVKSKSLKPLSAKQWQLKLNSESIEWQTISLSLVSKASTKAIAFRVKEVITQAYYRPGREYWLVIEKYGKDQYKYYLPNASMETPLTKLVEWAHERWKVEQGYQQLKEELGLDHFEGRSWRGIHHHLTLCFMAYAFLQLLKQDSIKKTLSYLTSNSTLVKRIISSSALSLLPAVL